MKASSSDVGTYYCAVAKCGEILFGNGANLNIQGKCAVWYIFTESLEFAWEQEVYITYLSHLFTLSQFEREMSLMIINVQLLFSFLLFLQ